MTLEIAILLGIIIAMIVLFALEVLPADTLAMTVMVSLILCGFVSPAEGVAGFSNQATIAVLSLMIISVGLETSGVITSLGNQIKPLFSANEWLTLTVLMVIVATSSSFISTTAVVIVFLRIMIRFSEKMKLDLSKILMPLSFAGILGGSCTLLGTSTNLLVNSITEDYELEPFTLFEFTYISITFLIAGVIYMVLVGRHLLPDRKDEEEDLTEEYTIQGFLTELVICTGSRLIGEKIKDTQLFKDQEIDLLEIKREGEESHFPNEEEALQEGDVLLVKGSAEKITAFRNDNDLKLLSRQTTKDEERLNTEDMTLVEVLIRPGSRLLGKSLEKVPVKRDYNAIPLAVRKNKEYITSELDEIKVEVGDTVLMEVGRSNFERFYNLPEFVVLQEYEELAAKSSKRYIATAIVLAVVLLAAFNILSILAAALAGAVAMFLTGCLELQRAYRRVDWSVYFLLAGVIPIGTAMDNTGASQLIADYFVQSFGQMSPRFLVAALFLLTTLLTAIISNNATAVLLAPIAVSIGTNLELDPRPLLLTVMFAANASFISPIGYQTNTLVYGPGDYKFMDYVRVGGILTLIVWGLTTLLIPYFYF